MTNPHLTFHHFGLAVRWPDKASHLPGVHSPLAGWKNAENAGGFAGLTLNRSPAS
jgi:hypothetical protein